MIEAGIDPVHFGTIMEKISRDPDTEPEGDGSDGEKQEDTNLLIYLSTHPSTPERMLQAERYSSELRKRLTR